MSDTLADLASWLPSEFLTGEMDDKALYLNSRNPHGFPYDLASSSSTESESDDEDIAGLTRRFTRSVSLQERIKTPYHLERGFSGSPVSTLNCNVYGPTQSRSSPTTPFVQADEDAWDLIYAAAGQVARMKMKTNNINDGVFGNRGVLGAPRPPGPPLTHQHHHNCAIWRSESEEFFRQQQFRLRFSGCANYGGGGRCGAVRPVGFRQPAWPSIPVENQRRQQAANGFVVKPVIGGSGGVGCGRRTAVVKRECAGTGVFLPRRYPNDPPELKKKPACPPAHLPARGGAQSFNKNMDPINRQPQPNIHGGFGPHYQLPPALPHHHHLKRDEVAEMVIARRNAMMLAQHRRSTTHVGVTEAQEVVLPQEWTY